MEGTQLIAHYLLSVNIYMQYSNKFTWGNKVDNWHSSTSLRRESAAAMHSCFAAATKSWLPHSRYSLIYWILIRTCVFFSHSTWINLKEQRQIHDGDRPNARTDTWTGEAPTQGPSSIGPITRARARMMTEAGQTRDSPLLIALFLKNLYTPPPLFNPP